MKLFNKLLTKFKEIRAQKYIPKYLGLIQSPKYIAEDPRKVYFREILMARGQETKPDEFFSRYAIEHCNAFIYSQSPQPSCVGETASRVLGVLDYEETDELKKPSVEAIMGYIKTRIEKNLLWGAYIESAPKAAMNWGDPFEDYFKSDYSLSWEDFCSRHVPYEIEEAGNILRPKGYAWTSKDIDSIKDGIFMADGNILQGAATGSNEGWKSGNIRPPKEGEKTWGHSYPWIGYSTEGVYLVNSWGDKWGMTLCLKKKYITESDYYYIKGNEQDYDIKIKGVGLIGYDYDNGLLSSSIGYIDLPNELARKTKMFNVIYLKGTKDQYIIRQDPKKEKRKIPDIETRQYLIDSGIITSNPPLEIIKQDFDMYETCELIPSVNLMRVLEPVVKDIFLNE